jgi:hypothetical protein
VNNNTSAFSCLVKFSRFNDALRVKRGQTLSIWTTFLLLGPIPAHRNSPEVGSDGSPDRPTASPCLPDRMGPPTVGDCVRYAGPDGPVEALSIAFTAWVHGSNPFPLPFLVYIGRTFPAKFPSSHCRIYIGSCVRGCCSFVADGNITYIATR